MILSVKKALNILECVASQSPKTLSKIASEVGVKPSACSHLVKTLTECGYLEQTAPKKGYVLGIMPYSLINDKKYNDKLTTIAAPVIENLAKKVNESVLLVTVKNNRKLVLLQADGTHNIKVDNRFFHLDGVYHTATGKLLISNMSDEEIAEFVSLNSLPEKNEWENIESYDDLIHEAEKIRQHGMVLDYSKPDIVQIAFPIIENGKVIAALGLYLPEYRFKSEHKREILSEMKKASNKINISLEEK